MGYLLNALISVAIPLVLKLLTYFGVGYATFTGVSNLTDGLTSKIIANLNGLPVSMLEMLMLLKVDIAMNIIITAVTVRMVMNGLNGGSFKKLRFGKK
ncbi:hypothetical protein tloyanaT_20980 [Thalassotalea loyana]|uniref:DUF2523 domain-containing protein n=1 Tax=Thalassotalea loyana TaxID=280483 RepID=A0ABQ6HG35_9GAMM|nr:DUF2523 domain-containing protein [Thalassotalea loyana]GLX85846.1 hypothetical protein tloyanaT_20980 [Thalassotalea loyana]